MLGQESLVRDIPERDGYDRIRLLVEGRDSTPLTLERSVEGGHFRAYDEAVIDREPLTEPKTLRWKHAATRQDTLSFALLKWTGLMSKHLRKNARGETRSLSFRDLARLCVITEQEIQRRGSPILSGQHTSATPNYYLFNPSF